MSDSSIQRRMMVDCQLRTYDITDARVLDAMGDVPREPFVSSSDRVLAYSDQCPAASEGPRGPETRYLLTPMVFARLLQAAEIKETDKVLDVAAGAGYSSAVLSRLAGSVVALESDPALAERATKILAEGGAQGVSVVQGSLAKGESSRGPYDVIVVNGAFQVEPTQLFAQLSDGGRLVGVHGVGRAGRAMVYRKVGTSIGGRTVFDAAAPVLAEFTREPAFTF
jgi:protein-L-isoaspartate(D-aspartate) O-methyltransferase